MPRRCQIARAPAELTVTIDVTAYITIRIPDPLMAAPSDWRLNRSGSVIVRERLSGWLSRAAAGT
jgi:hypothetical protein